MLPQEIIYVFADTEFSFTSLPCFIHGLRDFKIKGSEHLVCFICTLVDNTPLLMLIPDDFVNI